jgi:hypothetical protein
VSWFWGCWSRGSGWSAGGLVVAGGVEGELSEELAGGGVDDADLEVSDEDQDVGSGVGSADADVVESAGVAEGDGAGGVDDVGAEAVVGVVGGGVGAGDVDGGGGGPLGQGPMGALVVVVGGEGVELGLEGGEVVGGVTGGQPLLQGELEAFDLALGLGVAGPSVFLGDVEAGQFGLEAVAAAFPAGEAGGVDQAVVGEGGGGDAVGGAGGPEGAKDDPAGGDRAGGQVEGVAGVVIDPRDDLDLAGIGEVPVDEVGLPGLVGLRPWIRGTR